MKRLTAIGLIWLGCTIAWVILGSTLLMRSGSTSAALDQEVAALWGPSLTQSPPRALYIETRKVQEHQNNSVIEREEEIEHDLSLERSELDVKLSSQQRQKGLLWFATYSVGFRGRYEFVNDSGADRAIILRFPLSTEQAVYEGFEVRDEHDERLQTRVLGGVAEWKGLFRAGEHRRFVVAYRSRGTGRWGYQLAAGTGQVRAFQLAVDADVGAVDFPAGTLSPSRHGRVAGGGWHGEWTFSSLVASQPIGIELPSKLNPGPLASKITFFAPVGLLFFFFVVAVLAAAGRRRVHPLNYFFLGCAFFAFHLLFAYLVDHLAIAPSFGIASLVSLALVVSYARLFVGLRVMLREVTLAQLIYLVLFSFTFFWSGFTGLAITIGAIVTLFVMMQVTGRVDWEEATRS
jgi:hypothetical protein